ncbi:MAG: FHA domain-containing protein [Micrococcales bacterium]|nr:FHA domain-containing protein [Micrococcales bacterium]
MSVQTDQAPVVAVRRFVDGTLVSGLFEQLLRTDTSLRTFLSSQRAPSTIGGPLLRYLRELDWLQPKDVFEAQRVLVGLLVAAGEDVSPTDRYERRARLFDQQLALWARVQPTWLNISPTYFSTLLEQCEGMAEDSLEKAMKAKVRTLFRYRGRPPVWLHDENWPVNANGPLTFVEQIDISGPYDTSYRYVFRDETSREKHELVQSTARFEPKSPLPPSSVVGSTGELDIMRGLDFALVPPGDENSMTVPMPVLQALAEALEALDDGLDDDDPVIDDVPVWVAPQPPQPEQTYHQPPDPRPYQPQAVLPSPVNRLPDHDATLPIVRPTSRWAVEVDEGGQVELWSTSVVIGRSPQVSTSDVQRLIVAWDPSLLDTHARLDLIYGSWWVTNFGVDNGVTVIGARGGRVSVPTGRSAPVRTRLWLGSATVDLIALPDPPQGTHTLDSVPTRLVRRPVVLGPAVAPAPGLGVPPPAAAPPPQAVPATVLLPAPAVLAAGAPSTPVPALPAPSVPVPAVGGVPSMPIAAVPVAAVLAAVGTPLGVPAVAPPSPPAGVPAPGATTTDAPMVPVMPQDLWAVSSPVPGPGPYDMDITVQVGPPLAEPWTLALDDGRSFLVRERTAVVGRRPTSAPGVQAVMIADTTRTLSRTHARLDFGDDGWVVTDLGSTNGVLVTDVDGAQRQVEPGHPTPVCGYVAFGSVEARLLAPDQY